RHALVAAGPDHPVLGLAPSRVGALDLHGAGPGEASAAAHELDAVLLEERLDALRQPVGHAAAVVDRPAVVEPQLAGHHAEGGALLAQRLDELGTRQQRLRRDAAPIEADAARALRLDHRDAHAELRGADRAHVAAGAGSHHHEVEAPARAARPG